MNSSAPITASAAPLQTAAPARPHPGDFLGAIQALLIANGQHTVAQTTSGSAALELRPDVQNPHAPDQPASAVPAQLRTKPVPLQEAAGAPEPRLLTTATDALASLRKPVEQAALSEPRATDGKAHSSNTTKTSSAGTKPGSGARLQASAVLAPEMQLGTALHQYTALTSTPLIVPAASAQPQQPAGSPSASMNSPDSSSGQAHQSGLSSLRSSVGVGTLLKTSAGLAQPLSTAPPQRGDAAAPSMTREGGLLYRPGAAPVLTAALGTSASALIEHARSVAAPEGLDGVAAPSSTQVTGAVTNQSSGRADAGGSLAQGLLAQHDLPPVAASFPMDARVARSSVSGGSARRFVSNLAMKADARHASQPPASAATPGAVPAVPASGPGPRVTPALLPPGHSAMPNAVAMPRLGGAPASFESANAAGVAQSEGPAGNRLASELVMPSDLPTATSPAHVLERLDQAAPAEPLQLHSDARHLAVGVESGSLGWVEVHAVTNAAGHVEATIQTQTDAAAREVASQTSDVLAYAREHASTLSQLSVDVGQQNEAPPREREARVPMEHGIGDKGGAIALTSESNLSLGRPDSLISILA